MVPTGTQQRSREPERDSGGKKMGTMVAVLGLATAVLTLLTAYLGYQTASLSKQEKEAQAAAQSNQQRADGLQQENEDLRSSLNVPSATTRPSASPSERHSGQITLASTGGQADLDAPQSDPQWSTDSTNGQGDLEYYSGTQIYFSYGNKYLPLGNTLADYDTCRTTTGYISGGSKPVRIGDVQPGTYYCVLTSENRYSAIKVLSINQDEATFDVVTYDPPIK
jgi:hypothetical protein